MKEQSLINIHPAQANGELASLAAQFDAAIQGETRPIPVAAERSPVEKSTPVAARHEPTASTVAAKASSPRTLPLPPWEDDPAAPPAILKPCPTAPIRSTLSTQAAPPPASAPLSRAPVVAPFRIDADRFRVDIAVTPTTLNACWLAQSELENYYGQWVTHADMEFERIRTMHAVLEARLFAHHRKVLAAEGGRVLERSVDSAVKLDANWQAAMQLVLDAQGISLGNRQMMQALRVRHEVLAQLCRDGQGTAHSHAVDS